MPQRPPAKSPVDSRQFQKIAKAIADPSRLAALELIVEHGEVSCSALHEHLGVTAATVSHHVKELAASGLVNVRKDAKYSRLSLNRPVWRSYLKALQERLGRG